MPLKGTLETFYMASLLQLLATDEKTGILKVNDNEKEAKIFLKEGIIVYATSSQKEFRLGRFMKMKGIVPDEILQKCLRTAEVENQRLGRILVERGYLSKERLKQVLHDQVKEILYNLLLWKKGEFEYQDVGFNVEGKLIAQVNTMEIVLEASRRIDEWSVIKEKIPHGGVIFKISRKIQDSDEINLSQNEWRVLSLIISGDRSASELVKESGYDEFAAYKIIYSLMLSGLVEIVGEKVVVDEDDFDYDGSIRIYFDIFQAIRKNLKPEMGKKLTAIFEECEEKLSYDQYGLLRNLDFQNPVNENIDVLTKAMAGLGDDTKKRTLLLNSFNGLLENLLEKETEMIGFMLTRKTIEEINQILAIVQEYQKDSTEKMKILLDIENILSKAKKEIVKKEETESKSGGVFSLLGIK